MTDSCSDSVCGNETAKADPRWRRILWIALIVNAAMFFVEMVAGAAADSRALQADALDFLGDAANYAISLAVVGAALNFSQIATTALAWPWPRPVFSMRWARRSPCLARPDLARTFAKSS